MKMRIFFFFELKNKFGIFFFKEETNGKATSNNNPLLNPLLLFHSYFDFDDKINEILINRRKYSIK